MRYLGQESGIFCMDQGWRFSPVDYSVLPDDINHDTVYNYAKGGGARGPAESSYDDSNWQAVTLPHDWMVERAFRADTVINHGAKERGAGWYRLRFCLEEEDRDKHLILEFEGMSANAEIYLNGMLLKRSFSGYNGFYVDITPMAHYGITPNILAIHIDATAWEGWWYEGAGIYRHVWLHKKAQTHIAVQGVRLTPRLEDGQWHLDIETELENHSGTAQKLILTHHITAPDGSMAAIMTTPVDIGRDTTEIAKQSIMLDNAQLWDIGVPNLYHVRTELAHDEQILDFQEHHTGLRTIRFDADSGFWLNGRNVKLKGFCNHQDHPGVGVAVPYNVKKYRVRTLLESGANAYRCAHNPDPEILTACDELGMLVMEENRIFSPEPDNLKGLDWIVKNARNHPCVILYSIGNEEPLLGTEKGYKIAEIMVQRIKRLDDTRPVTAAFSSGFLDVNGAVNAVDVVGINYNDLWYESFRKQFPNKPVFGSETSSAYSVRGCYQSNHESHLLNNYDQEKAAWGASVRKMWRDIDSRPYMAGTFVWSGFDYRGEPTPFTWPSIASFFGTWDSCGYAKDAVWLYKALWTDEPMIHISSPWADAEQVGKEITVMVMTNCDKLRLLANGKVVAEVEVDRYEQFTCTLLCETGELIAEGWKNGMCVARDIQRTAGAAVQLRVTAESKELVDSCCEAALFHVEVCDSNGAVVPNADNLLRFQVENGTIIGVGNGDPNSHEPDVADFRKAFHGRAQVIVRPDGKDDVRLTVTTGEMQGIATANVHFGKQLPVIQAVNERIVEGWKFFYQIFSEKPSGVVELQDCDMNSYMPVSFTGQPQRELMFQNDMYGLYVAQYNFAGKAKNSCLYFQHINGAAWIYLNGQEIAHRTEDWYGSMRVPLPVGLSGTHTITVIVQNADHEHPFAGICSPVFYRDEEQERGNDDE